MSSTYCHVIGLSDENKKTFMQDINNSYNIIDLNHIFKEIKDDSYYKKILTNMAESKSKYEKNGIQKCIDEFIKTKIDSNISNSNNNNKNKKTIVVGLNVIDNNKYDILSDHKYVIKHDIETCAKQTVKNNIKKHFADIVGGSFPLNNIDVNSVVKNKEQIINDFTKNGYTKINYNELIRYLNTSDNTENNAKVYIASDSRYNKYIKTVKKQKFDDIIDTNDNFIYGYSLPWLAIANYVDKNGNDIEKGFINDNPYLKIKNIQCEDKLNKSCYLYELDKNNFVKASDKNMYKFKTINANIISRTKIENIKQELEKYGTKIMI